MLWMQPGLRYGNVGRLGVDQLTPTSLPIQSRLACGVCRVSPTLSAGMWHCG
eukprot:m.453512 g.453512  ORF g.453512 m.453512 type:complete len:52 (+) comp186538_c0_seq1:86-241(+)